MLLGMHLYIVYRAWEVPCHLTGSTGNRGGVKACLYRIRYNPRVDCSQLAHYYAVAAVRLYLSYAISIVGVLCSALRGEPVACSPLRRLL